MNGMVHTLVKMKKFLVNLILFLYFITSTLVRVDTYEASRNWDEKETNVLRISNGAPARLGEVPYQVSFKINSIRHFMYMSFCGGTIIGPSKVLSAAHCFAERNNIFLAIFRGRFKMNFDLKKISVVAGQLRTISDFDRQGQWRKILNVTFPNSFNFPRHDIAIVFVTTPWTFDANVNSIEYSSMFTDFRGIGLISGHGRTQENARNTSHVLLWGTTNFISASRCTRLHKRTMTRYICTAHFPSSTQPGDSGGPLISRGTSDPNEKNRGILVGITSGAYGFLPFFTRISPYYSYIERNNSIPLEKLSSLVLIPALYLINSLNYMYNVISYLSL